MSSIEGLRLESYRYHNFPVSSQNPMSSIEGLRHYKSGSETNRGLITQNPMSSIEGLRLLPSNRAFLVYLTQNPMSSIEGLRLATSKR